MASEDSSSTSTRCRLIDDSSVAGSVGDSVVDELDRLPDVESPPLDEKLLLDSDQLLDEELGRDGRSPEGALEADRLFTIGLGDSGLG